MQLQNIGFVTGPGSLLCDSVCKNCEECSPLHRGWPQRSVTGTGHRATRCYSLSANGFQRPRMSR